MARQKPSAPNKPSITITKTTSTKQTVKVSWEKPSKNNSGIIGYEINTQWSGDIQDPLGLTAFYVDGNKTSYSETILRGKRIIKLGLW